RSNTTSMARSTLPKLNKLEAAVVINGEASDLKASRPGKGQTDERDLGAELHGRFDPKKNVDKFEESRGRGPRTSNHESFMRKYRWKNIILEPANLKDQELLAELMNNPKYRILVYKDTFN